jgi:hypothetical protein
LNWQEFELAKRAAGVKPNFAFPISTRGFCKPPYGTDLTVSRVQKRAEFSTHKKFTALEYTNQNARQGTTEHHRMNSSSTKRKASAFDDANGASTLDDSSNGDPFATLVSPATITGRGTSVPTMNHGSSSLSLLSAPIPLRRSCRRPSKRQILNIKGHSRSTDEESYGFDFKRVSPLNNQDPLEFLGKQFWERSKEFVDPKARFLSMCNRGDSNWAFFPSKHCKKELFKSGLRGVHYALGYGELGQMVKDYGDRNVAKDWPNLPSIKAEVEEENSFEATGVPIATAVTKRRTEDPLIADFDSSTYTPESCRTVALSIGTPKASIKFTKERKKHGDSSDSNCDPPNHLNPMESSIESRLKRLEGIFFGKNNNSIDKQGILQRLEYLEAVALGDKRDEELRAWRNAW